MGLRGSSGEGLRQRTLQSCSSADCRLAQLPVSSGGGGSLYHYGRAGEASTEIDGESPPALSPAGSLSRDGLEWRTPPVALLIK